jgi:hypothetical protein
VSRVQHTSILKIGGDEVIWVGSRSES